MLLRWRSKSHHEGDSAQNDEDKRNEDDKHRVFRWRRLSGWWKKPKHFRSATISAMKVSLGRKRGRCGRRFFRGKLGLRAGQLSIKARQPLLELGIHWPRVQQDIRFGNLLL